MPRVHRRKAAKDYPDKGISKGEMYYQWSIKLSRGGIVCRSKDYPRPSQLNLGFAGQIGDLALDLEAATSPEDMHGIAETVRELGEEQREKFDNMPEGLQQGDTGQLLEERADQCEEWANAIDEAADALETALDEIEGMDAEALELSEDADADEIEHAREEKRGEALDEAVSEASGAAQF